MSQLQCARARAASFSKCVGAFVLTACWSAAQAVVIAPVIVEISPSRRVASVAVSNPDDTPVNFQVQVLAWTQADGVDQYAETSQLIVVPPIAEIAAGGSQVFRVTTRLPPGPRETAFRLIFEDVTQLADAVGETDGMQVVLRVNHNLPVFFAAAEASAPLTRVLPCHPLLKAGRGCVRLENSGNSFVFVKSLAVSGGGWRKDLPLSGRLLAGAWKQWDFEVPAYVSGELQVSVDTSAGPVSGVLQVDERQRSESVPR